jgi:hypothetical protein
MRSVFLLFFIVLGFQACRPSEDVSPDTLTGIWIEASARQDTLRFNVDGTGVSLPNTLLVNRGKEKNASGYLLPKMGSGLYSYTIQGTRIYVHSLLSSSSQGADYAIERRGAELRMDNFFELAPRQPATATRTLIRL